jgi:23S rRNA (uracil1939-C5)-methyltransferase
MHVGPGQRRRATLTASDTGRGIVLGFHAGRSHALIDIEMCPVLMPELVAVLPGLRTLAGMLFAARAKSGKRNKSDDLRISIAYLSGAVDVSVEGVRAPLDAGHRRDAATLADRHSLQRISVDGDIIIMRDLPRLKTSGGEIEPQPGAFFQAVEKAEHRMAEVVTSGVGNAKRVADLFAGIGTFTLPLAKRARVEAFDTEVDALTALNVSARKAQGLKPITTRVRDLFKEPVSLMELRDFDAVVLDPPRAGALAQSEILAASPLKRVVMVSCHPATLARDIRCLLDGGYVMESFVAIDQFHWTAHIEAVAVMVRPKKR